ncbi:MAG: TRAP transporter substrate-binding protein DctP [Microvirga sp.]|nr:TRAP transporter substrate-binding protein DctP [Microvirga sp.]
MQTEGNGESATDIRSEARDEDSGRARCRAARPLLVTALASVIVAVGAMLPGPAAAQTYTMTIAHLYPDDLESNETAPALAHFQRLVEAATGGDLKIEAFGNGALGGESEIAQQARSGRAVQSVMLGSGTQAGFFRRYEMVTAPFLFADYRTAWAFFDSPWFADFMRPMIAESGLRYLGTLDDGGGFVAFANNRAPIRSVDDLRGLRIRVEENQAHMTIVAALGATPVSLPWAEVQTGLATGLIDGHFHAPGVNDIFRLYDVTRYTTWSGHIYNTITWSVSEAWFQTLPREYQEIVVSAAREAVAMAHGAGAKISVIGWANSCARFAECHVLDEDERERMRAVAEPPYREWLTREFGEGAALFDEMRAEIARIRDEIETRTLASYLD